MRIWETLYADLGIRSTGSLSANLAAWPREIFAAVPAGPVEVETNLGGFDEAGYPSPDFDRVSMVAEEFPHHQVRVAYQLPRTREEAVAPYEIHPVGRLDSTGMGGNRGA